MEESEKRRQRLRAMRMEAEEVVSTTSPSSPHMISSVFSTPLANPLLETSSNEESLAAVQPPRFDFYTDPMAAYSSDKRRTGPQFPPSPSGPRNPEMPFPGVQFQNNYSPYQSMHQGGNPYYSPGPAGSPMGIRSPYPLHQGSPSFSCAAGRGHGFNNSPSPGSGRGGGPYPVHQGTQDFRSPSQGRGFWSNNSPSPVHGRGGSPSPSPSVGRGKGPWDGNNMSPGLRHSGGRGRGRGCDGDFRARSFYDKSMVEDPWESLTPVFWQKQSPSPIPARSVFHNRGSVQMTSGAKKPRVSNPSHSSNPKPSLAEFLAASFDEAVGDEIVE